MVMQDINSTTDKNGHASRAILMAMQIRWYGAKRITQYGRYRATLDAAAIRPVFAPYRPSGCHGHRYQRKK